MRLAPVWYLIQFDIRDLKRGQKVYRLLKTCAFSVQESVFAWQGNLEELATLKKNLSKLINLQEDDVRGYQIHNPLALFGASPFASDTYFSGYPTHQHSAMNSPCS